MKESVWFSEELPMRNSLILTGLTFRTFWAAVSDCILPVDWFVQRALAVRSPLNIADPEVTLNVAFTLEPGATGSAIVTDVLPLPGITAVQPFGAEILNSTPLAAAPVVFVNVTVVSNEEPVEKV